MQSVRSIKELRTACKCLLNYENAFWVDDIHLVSEWITRSTAPKSTEQSLKQDLFDILIKLKKYSGKYGFIDRTTGEIIEDIYDESTPIVFQNKNFWFTGKAFYGARKKCEEAIAARGGSTLENKMMDYLIVGLFDESLIRGDYYSNKIEIALSNKYDRHEERYRIGFGFGFNEKGEFYTSRATGIEEVLIKAKPIPVISEERWIREL